MPRKRAIVGDDRLFHRGHGVVDLGRRRLQLGMGLDHFLSHLVLNVGEINRGFLFLSDPLADQRPVARAQVVERPDDAHVHVEAAAVELRAAVGSAAENAAVEGAAGSVSPFHHHTGNQGRTRSCRTRSRLACTNARCEANSGRFVKPTGTRSATLNPGEISDT